VGYSFGDNHINGEIEGALASKDNKTIVVAFSRENVTETGTEICAILKQWLENEEFGSRIYVATNKALYHGHSRYAQEPAGADLQWWTFDGVTKFLESGALI
jgi:hypothetical protein